MLKSGQEFNSLPKSKIYLRGDSLHSKYMEVYENERDSLLTCKDSLGVITTYELYKTDKTQLRERMWELHGYTILVRDKKYNAKAQELLSISLNCTMVIIAMMFIIPFLIFLRLIVFR